MKLASLYLVWNALELFEGSIKQIYDHTDVIILGWQKVSHYGKVSYTVEGFVNTMKKKYPKIVLFEFKPKVDGGSTLPKIEERRKINQMLVIAHQHECTHFFVSATDHYYNTSEFLKGKEIAKNYQVTASKMYTYFKEPRWRLKNLETYYMPFICELSKLTYSKDTRGEWNVLVDPALCIVPNDSFYEFKEDELMLHHYSFVREDIESKLKNAAARRNFSDKIPEIIQRYKDFNGVGLCPYFEQEVIEVENLFNIQL